MTPEARTPLTLEFEPEGLEDEPEAKNLIVIEPSMQHAGRIFVGINPFGKRRGCHLLPHDALRVYKHLGTLLMEEEPVDWQERISQAAARQAPKPRRRRRRALFRLEFQVGKVQGIIGTMNNE